MRWLRSLPFLCLLALTGCASMQLAGAPPAHLLLDCPEPEIRASTNGELARSLQRYRWALRSCNDDKAALREWQKD